jgi:cysteinyl-tRNA synthetase
MSKSLGNVVTVEELLASGWQGEEIRYALLTAHYRQPLEWSDRILKTARQTLSSYRRMINQFRGIASRANSRIDLSRSLFDDLNTPAALTHLHQLHVEADRYYHDAKLQYGWLEFESGQREQQKAVAAFRDFMTLSRLLGLFERRSVWTEQPPQLRWLAEALIDERTKARSEGRFDEADLVRRRAIEHRIVLEDTPNGTTWRRA